MKLNNLNKTQQKAYLNIKAAMMDYIGDYGNQLLDYSKDEEEWKEAYEALTDPVTMTNTIYHWSTSYYYQNGNPISDKRSIDEIKFCGKEWLMEAIQDNMNKIGYRECYLALIDSGSLLK